LDLTPASTHLGLVCSSYMLHPLGVGAILSALGTVLFGHVVFCFAVAALPFIGIGLFAGPSCTHCAVCFKSGSLMGYDVVSV
jgi:hypothetical protein